MQAGRFATCAAAALGIGSILNSPVVPRSISQVPGGVPCSAPGAPSCCCDMAALVAFDVVAANMSQAEAYAAAVPDLTGPAMVQCLQVLTVVHSQDM